MGVSRGLPYFPCYPDDFTSDGAVEAMSTEQVGAYFLLLCKAWREFPAGSVPDDDAVLGRWARMSPARWKKARAGVLRPWVLWEGRWHQKRMQREYRKLLIRSDKAKEAVEARWEKIRGLRTNESGSDPALPPQNGRSASASTDVQRTHYQPEPDPEPYPEPDPEPHAEATNATGSSSKALRGGARGGAVPDGDAIDTEWERGVEEVLENVSLHGKKDLAFLNQLRQKKPRLEPEAIRDQLLEFQRQLTTGAA
jgi:uncharacterized protein YdaU (DUF1376 family)